MQERAEQAAGAYKRILIVDDEPDVIAALACLLEDNGYLTCQARSADEAVKQLEKTPLDLICLDIMMPGPSGIALYQRIKLDPRFKDIPAVFISGFSMARDFSGSGFRKLVPDPEVPAPQAYLGKPLEPARLLQVIKGIIG